MSAINDNIQKLTIRPNAIGQPPETSGQKSVSRIQPFDLGFRIADFGLRKKQHGQPTQIPEID
jgi:hypothetical protein